jgi:hypothetical protein
MKSPKFFAIALALSALLSACAPVAATPAAAPMPELVPPMTAGGRAEADTFARDAERAPAAEPGQQVAAPRLIIKNASLTLVVGNVGEQIAQVKQIAADYNGFVVTQNVSKFDSHERANITLRVDADKLDLALERLRKLSIEVRNENISGEDVTAEFVDLESNLKNLTAAEAQLQKLLDQAASTEDVVEVFKQLTEIRGQIESIKGRMKFLQASAAQSLITLEMIPDAASQPVEATSWRPGGTVNESVEMLIRSLQGLADAAIVIAIVIVPQLLLIAIPIAALIWVVRKLIKRNAARKLATTVQS